MNKKIEVTYMLTFTREVKKGGTVYVAGKEYTFTAKSESSNRADMFDAAYDDITARFGKVVRHCIVQFAPIVEDLLIIEWREIGKSKQSKQAGLAEVFTLERNAHGEFEIIGCLREGVL